MTRFALSRKDKRPLAILVTLAAVLLGGALIANFDRATEFAKSLRTRGHAEMARRTELDERWQQGIVMLHARHFDNAVTAFHRVLQLAPKMPEAHANMGFALIGLEQYAAARDFFESATELNREQSNAYYGLALAHAELGEYAAAVGAMRTYLHRTPAADPYRAKASEALATWDAEMRKAQAAAAASPPPAISSSSASGN